MTNHVERDQTMRGKQPAAIERGQTGASAVSRIGLPIRTDLAGLQFGRNGVEARLSPVCRRRDDRDEAFRPEQLCVVAAIPGQCRDECIARGIGEFGILCVQHDPQTDVWMYRVEGLQPPRDTLAGFCECNAAAVFMDRSFADNLSKQPSLTADGALCDAEFRRRRGDGQVARNRFEHMQCAQSIPAIQAVVLLCNLGEQGLCGEVP